MNKEQIRQVLQEIADDMEADAKAFDGRPFNGRTVAEYFGNQGAAIRAVALAVKALYEEGSGGREGAGAAMSKQNEFICPTCGHRWFDSCAYGTCDKCFTFFYLSQAPRIVAASPPRTERPGK